MPTYEYEFYLLVVNSISRSFAALTREISSWPLEDKIHIHARACNILYVRNVRTRSKRPPKSSVIELLGKHNLLNSKHWKEGQDKGGEFLHLCSLRSWRDSWAGEWRRSRHIPRGRSPQGISRAAKPRVKFPPATFRMGFACRPLLSLSMNQLNKPIRERSVTWT